jgi:hypothetical protein
MEALLLIFQIISAGDISFNVQDVFIWILRSLADAVAAGANAVRLNKASVDARIISPEHSEMFQKLRQTIGKDRINPLNAFVTSGKFYLKILKIHFLRCLAPINRNHDYYHQRRS